MGSPVTDQRLRALELLLESSEDHYGSSAYPPVWAGYGRALPGPAPSSRGPCRTCDGGGRLIPSGRPCVACRQGQPRSSHPCVPCGDCAGTGRRWFDDYTGEPVAHVERRLKKPAAGKARARHGVTVTDLSDHVARWEQAQELADKTGSYRELRAALKSLVARDPAGHKLVVAVHVRQSARALDELEVARLRHAMRTLSALMPAMLRLPQRLAEVLHGEQRGREARALLAGGASLREIQRDLGVRKSRLKRLIA